MRWVKYLHQILPCIMHTHASVHITHGITVLITTPVVCNHYTHGKCACVSYLIPMFVPPESAETLPAPSTCDALIVASTAPVHTCSRHCDVISNSELLGQHLPCRAQNLTRVCAPLLLTGCPDGCSCLHRTKQYLYVSAAVVNDTLRQRRSLHPLGAA